MKKINRFFAPQKAKMLIVIAFFAVQVWAFGVYETSPSETNSVMPLIYLLSFPGMFASYFAYGFHPLLRFLGTPVNLLYWYFLSCVMVLIWNTAKKS